MKHALTVALVLAWAGVMSAQSAPSSELTTATAAGKWIVSRGAGTEPIVLDIAVNDKKVTGTFDGGSIIGEFMDGKLTCADSSSWVAWREGTIGGDDAPTMYPTVAFATLKQDGTLAGWTDVFIRGYGPQAIKRISWTATRAK